MDDRVVHCESRQEEVNAILAEYTGYPDLPTGRPCGVLAYMFAHGKRTIDIPSADESMAAVSAEVPFFDSTSSTPARPYYAVIETNPSGLWVATLAKGAQDLIATKGESRRIIELGQPRDLAHLLDTLGADLPWENGGEAGMDLNDLHSRAVGALLDDGWSVRVESPFDAAIRETREEHGFDLPRCWEDVCSIGLLIDSALSKRKLDAPIEHFFLVVRVNTFDTTIPSKSRIIEEKNPFRFGHVYQEYGVYLTLEEMWDRYKAAEQVAHCDAEAYSAVPELIATKSRLQLLGRIEQSILNTGGPVALIDGFIKTVGLAAGYSSRSGNSRV